MSFINTKLCFIVWNPVTATGSKYTPSLGPTVVTNMLLISNLQCRHALKEVPALTAVGSAYKPTHSSLPWNLGDVTVPNVPSWHHSEVQKHCLPWFKDQVLKHKRIKYLAKSHGKSLADQGTEPTSSFSSPAV